MHMHMHMHMQMHRCAMHSHEAKLRTFGPFKLADERFVAALTTKLRPEVYMPEAYILVRGQVYSYGYFIDRGMVQLTWPAENKEMVNVLSVDDHFGELSLFVTRKLSFTVRSITHVDTFRLEKADFMEVMRSHPAGAVHVADRVGTVLPSKMARQVAKEIYDYSGLRELLAMMKPGRWRPTKGLADKILKFAVESGQSSHMRHLHNKATQRARRRVSCLPGPWGGGAGANGGTNSRPSLILDDNEPPVPRHLSVPARDGTSSPRAVGGVPPPRSSAAPGTSGVPHRRGSTEGESEGSSSARTRQDLEGLAASQERLAKRVDRNQTRLEAQLSELATLVARVAGSGGGHPGSAIATAPPPGLLASIASGESDTGDDITEIK